jgi:C4-dicarboxylate transporter DctM subunit
MVAFMFIAFGVLLVMSVPISVVLLGVTAGTLQFFQGVPLQAVVQQLFNGMDNFILLAIPFFILAGSIMAEGKISTYLVEVMNLFVGRFHGGLAIGSILACIFFAAISGSSPATVIAIGSIMIPALVKSGYNERFSIGLLTSSGSLGILIPPSIPMVLYCLVMNESVGRVFMAGVVPGLFIGLVLILYSFILARKHGWRNDRKYTLKEALSLIRKASWGLAMPVIVLGGIYAGIFTPTEAAGVSVVYAVLVEVFIYRGLTWARFNKTLREGAVLSASLLFIIACAMAFIWLLTREQLPVKAAEFITAHITNKYLFLLAINLLLLFIGCLMDIVSAILVLSPILYVTLQQFNIDLIHFAIMMIVNVEFGFLTFPFGLNLFVSMGLTGKPLTEVAKAVMPFLILLLFCLLAITFIPWLSLVLPNWLMPVTVF